MEWSRVNNMELHEQKFEVVSNPLNASMSLREQPFYPTTLGYNYDIIVNQKVIAPRYIVRDL
jgi:hypothetical protein